MPYSSQTISTPRKIFNFIRWIFMPGLDLFTRRRQRLSRYWMKGERFVLDAGCGNGWFAYMAYRTGAHVTGVSALGNEIEKAKAFYNYWMDIPEGWLSFCLCNLYDLQKLPERYHEIICYETLEHVMDDKKVCELFWDRLAPGGVLHLCCPNAEHPRWKNEPLDLEEKGYHVRAGYTLESYKALLEPIGFQIETVKGMGAPALVRASMILEKLRNIFGDLLCFPLALLLFPLVIFDPEKTPCPYSLYVKAVKPKTEEV